MLTILQVTSGDMMEPKQPKQPKQPTVESASYGEQKTHAVSNHNRYLVKSLVHASRILEAFQSAGDVLRLRDVVARTSFNKGMCFRLLYTLHQCGFLDKVGENHYRLASEVRRRRLFRIGYAAQGQDASFDREVRDGRSEEHTSELQSLR